ncbi:cation/acetate symporter [Paraburkholderia unamae]|uniref:cation/acetate symporter ActP n=1 Tax=Paraburkholderia unamae TaxID=219649 RepID=UPI000DC20DC3|nr:cation/acetate symporter ActP [Paraburkholderia unamae]RAR57535.1 cation/acetate symporter [Paraburkholderia unamae]
MNAYLRLLPALGALIAATSAHAQDAATAAKTDTSFAAIGMFILFVLSTLVITRWAAKRTHTKKDFYSAGGGLTGFQNGLAISGDFMSAASFLGLTSVVFLTGYDGFMFTVGFLLGWPIVMFLLSEPVRNLGKFTVVDVVAYRLEQGPIRVMMAFTSITAVILYLVVQMVGAGKLIELLFGLHYWLAEVIVGSLMVIYVYFGGMKATTWVQMIKATLLLLGVTIMALLSLAHFGFHPDAMFKAANDVHPAHTGIMGSGHIFKDPWNALSFGIGGIVGVGGFPHLLMRLFTVSNASESRKSVFVATSLISYFYVLVLIVGVGAISILFEHPEYFKVGADGHFSLLKDLVGGPNMVAVSLSRAVGGNLFFGFIAAVTFATILAVVSGLVISGASSISHDLYASWIARGHADDRKEMKISRTATVVFGLIAIGLGIPFENTNVAFLVNVVAAIAGSANLPVFIMSIFWRGTTTRGAVVGGLLGLISALVVTLFSAPIWVAVLHNAKPLCSLNNPALISVPVAFLAIWFFSVTDKSARAVKERDAFDAQNLQAHTGLTVSEAVEH